MDAGCEVLIVGGGPAGSSCARALSHAGVRVNVWDARLFPRDKLCAGWITPQVMAELGIDAAAYRSGGRTLQPLRGFRVGVMDVGSTVVRYAQPVSYGIRRCEFDTYLLERSGASVHLGEPVRALERDRDGWLINGAVHARLLVGAGGHFCPVARAAGARLGQGEPVIAAQEIEFALPPRARCDVDPQVPEIYFNRALDGYGWVFRKGDYLNVGLGRLGNRKLAEHVGEFLAWLRRRGKIPDELPGKPHGHPYLLYDQAPRPLVGDRILLVGDAAGLAYPKSGEGIRPAIESGLLAAQVIAASAGRHDAEHLADYERRIVERFGARRTHSILDALPAGLTRFLGRRLFANPLFARRIVLDDWFFHRELPPLAAVPAQPAQALHTPAGTAQVASA